MSLPTPDEAINVLYKAAEIIGGFIIFATLLAFGALVKRYAVFKVQTDAIETLTVGLEAEQKRGDRLEQELKDVRAENARRDRAHAEEIVKLRELVARKEGVIDGRGHTIDNMYAAAVRSGGCELAFTGLCKNRIVPGQEAFDQMPSELKVGGTDE